MSYLFFTPSALFDYRSLNELLTVDGYDIFQVDELLDGRNPIFVSHEFNDELCRLLKFFALYLYSRVINSPSRSSFKFGPSPVTIFLIKTYFYANNYNTYGF